MSRFQWDSWCTDQTKDHVKYKQGQRSIKYGRCVKPTPPFPHFSAGLLKMARGRRMRKDQSSNDSISKKPGWTTSCSANVWVFPFPREGFILVQCSLGVLLISFCFFPLTFLLLWIYLSVLWHVKACYPLRLSQLIMILDKLAAVLVPSC